MAMTPQEVNEYIMLFSSEALMDGSVSEDDFFYDLMVQELEESRNYVDYMVDQCVDPNNLEEGLRKLAAILLFRGIKNSRFWKIVKRD